MMPLRSHGPSERTGGALVLALLVILLISGLTVALLHIGVSFNREQGGRLDDERALLLAEAGIDEGLTALRAGGTGNVGSQLEPARFGDGLFWSESEQVGNEVFLVRSVAMCGRGRAALERVIFRHLVPLITAALFSNQDLTLGTNCLIDSYESSLGSYASQVGADGSANDGAVVLSNGEVAVGSSVEVHGDIHPGVESQVDVSKSASVTGSLEPSAEAYGLEPVTAPPVPSLGNLNVPADGLFELGPGDVGFDQLLIQSGTLTIRGPARVVLDEWIVESNTEVILDTTNGAIEVYVSGPVDLQSNSSIVTTTASTTRMTLFLVGGPAQVAMLRSNAEFHGRIHAAESTVDMASNFELFGAVAAEQLIVGSNAKIHFDEDSLSVSSGDETFHVGGWSVLSFPLQEFRSDRGDPFELLGVVKDDLPSPGGAHDGG